MVLQLTDHSIRLRRGMIEDVLIKVGGFIFSVNFVVLKTMVVMSLENEISVIHGRPLLTTCNALINCRDKKVKLIFRNMTMELNVFNLYKQPMGFINVEHPTLNCVGDFLFGEVEFDHEEELISCMYKSFCVEYEPEFNNLHFRNNMMTHYMHLFLHPSLPFPLHLIRPTKCTLIFFS